MDRPSVADERIEGLRTLVLREPATGSEAHVCVDVGSNLCRFRTNVGGRALEVLAAPPDMATLRERPTRWGSACLFPYPGRIENGRFAFRGREVHLPRDPRDGHAIHGVVRARPWRVVSTEADERGARVTTAIGTREESIPAEEWPFPFAFALTVSLHGGVLRVEAQATNTGEAPMPMGLGFHPYFPTPLGPAGTAEECAVWVEADEQWEQAGPGLPTGRIDRLRPNDGLRQPRRLADIPASVASPQGNVRNLLFRRAAVDESDAPGGIPAGVVDRANGVEATLEASAGFGAMVFFTPAAPPVVSLEPHTCVPNAFNLASDLPGGMIVLEPGQDWRGWFMLRAEPLA